MKNFALSPNKLRRPARASERGVILLLACFSMPVLIGLLGLGIDLGVMYSIKAKLQMACDGAAVAALRSLNLGQDSASQTTLATAIAQQWFNANYADDFMGATGTGTPTVTVTDGISIRTVSVAATTQAPTYFMKYFGHAATPIGATSAVSRRDVAIMMVLDRSGSMNNSNNTYNGLSPCQVMVQAAKQFTGLFQQGRDRLGLTTFAESIQIVQSPTTNFQTALGYTNSTGSSGGALDAITCGSGTNTPSAISLSWNELYKLQMPGALNILVIFTDGTPTASTFDFSSVIAGGSTCANPYNWVAYRQANSGGAVSFGANSFFPDVSGMVGSVYGDLSNFSGIQPFYSPPGAAPLENLYTSSDAPGCSFSVNQNWNPGSDISAIPSQDEWGNPTTGYRAVPAGNIPMDSNTATNLGNAVFNLADNAASFARSGHVYSNGAAMPGTLVNTIGLGGNGGVDFTLLQRMANDPNPGPNGVYPGYPGYNSAQPVGQFLYSSDASQLQAAFIKLGSQILRISR